MKLNLRHLVYSRLPLPIMLSLLMAFNVLGLTSLGYAKRPKSLIGGRASLIRQNQFAKADRLRKFKTPKDVRKAVNQKKVVRVKASQTLELAYVSFPYAHPKLNRFLHRLSKAFFRHCRTPLVVTSLVRPQSKQPRNASVHSVHPTGIAVDLRVPPYECRNWLNQFLVSAEKKRLLEATRELRPPHYHVVIHPHRIDRAKELMGPHLRKRPSHSKKRRKRSVNRRSARSKKLHKNRSNSYKVRAGDSLWALARRWKVSIQTIKRFNQLKTNRIDAGQKLYIPQ